MIEFNYETKFQLHNEDAIRDWVCFCVKKEGFRVGELAYIFCDDEYLHKLNIEFLNHNTFTDIISFDNTLGKIIGGDIFISIERVKENAKTYNVLFLNELHRVLIHGVLHFIGYKDKLINEKEEMRSKENDCLNSIESFT